MGETKKVEQHYSEKQLPLKKRPRLLALAPPPKQEEVETQPQIQQTLNPMIKSSSMTKKILPCNPNSKYQNTPPTPNPVQNNPLPPKKRFLDQIYDCVDVDDDDDDDDDDENVRRVLEYAKANKDEGSELKLVIEKLLQRTDIDPHQARLAIPASMVRTHGILTEPERQAIHKEKSEVEVKVVGPTSVDEPPRDMALGRWNYAQKEGKEERESEREGGGWKYVLKRGWTKLLKEESKKKTPLNEGDIIQVWSFRRQGVLHLALVVTARAPPRPHHRPQMPCHRPQKPCHRPSQRPDIPRWRCKRPRSRRIPIRKEEEY